LARPLNACPLQARLNFIRGVGNNLHLSGQCNTRAIKGQQRRFFCQNIFIRILVGRPSNDKANREAAKFIILLIIIVSVANKKSSEQTSKNIFGYGCNIHGTLLSLNIQWT
jgi:hypothetical protein